MLRDQLQVSSRIRADLLQRAGEFNIKLEDVSITHLTFGKVSRMHFILGTVADFPRNTGIYPGTHMSKVCVFYTLTL